MFIAKQNVVTWSSFSTDDTQLCGRPGNCETCRADKGQLNYCYGWGELKGGFWVGVVEFICQLVVAAAMGACCCVWQARGVSTGAPTPGLCVSSTINGMFWTVKLVLGVIVCVDHFRLDGEGCTDHKRTPKWMNALMSFFTYAITIFQAFKKMEDSIDDGDNAWAAVFRCEIYLWSGYFLDNINGFAEFSSSGGVGKPCRGQLLGPQFKMFTFNVKGGASFLWLFTMNAFDKSGGQMDFDAHLKQGLYSVAILLGAVKNMTRFNAHKDVFPIPGLISTLMFAAYNIKGAVEHAPVPIMGTWLLSFVGLFFYFQQADW